MARHKIKRLKSYHLHFIVTIISLAFNIAFIVGYLIVSNINERGELDTAHVNYGVNLMCSDEYRQKYQDQVAARGDDGKKLVALMDFSCSKNGAGPYFEKGYNEYIQTLGLKT